MTGKTSTVNMFIDPAIKRTNNGIQIFAKDSNWKYVAGKWYNVDDNNVGEWITISLDFSNSEWIYNKGFDITQIKAISIKILMGEQTPPREIITGSYWLDSMNY